MVVGYETLPYISVIPPLLTINFKECEHMPHEFIPVLENIYLEQYEDTIYTVND